ncbi:MAG: epoxyqueuosine reductase QueH [Elusimicrobia bacterium]|nr:epoxyqueuosine reductase QueH [Candidatus Liberimonas magnetica]
MKILLHHCCVPCSPAIVEDLKKDFEITSFWFNPNIQPKEEYDKRKISFELYIKSLDIPVYFGSLVSCDIWDQGRWKDKASRCRACYLVRLNETALTAKKMNIDYFSTTLLSSPYQMHDLILEAGTEASKKHGSNFVYRDLRKSYYKGKDLSRNQGYYIQKYCGCLLSKKEREEQRHRDKGGNPSARAVPSRRDFK